jgi:hypothetical protein
VYTLRLQAETALIYYSVPSPNGVGGGDNLLLDVTADCVCTVDKHLFLPIAVYLNIIIMLNTVMLVLNIYHNNPW